MGMAANENPGTQLLDEPPGSRVIVPRIASYMRNGNPHTLQLKELELRNSQPYYIIVAIALDTSKRLKLLNVVQSLYTAKVARVPYLIHRLQKCAQLIVKPTMGVGN